jgi:hypothetical protein
MASCDLVKRVPRKRLNYAPYPILLRWCGFAALLGGVLFVVWGYIDRPNIPETLKAVIHVLAFVVPTLFLTAVFGLCVLWRSRLGMLGWLGMALAVYAWGWSVVGASVGGEEAVWAYFAQREWPHYLASWLLFMLSGLTLMGVATVRSEWSRGTGAVVLATGVFGWVYNLTDSRALLEARSVHIGFGLLFSLGWVVLGVGLLAAGTKRSPRPQADG